MKLIDIADLRVTSLFLRRTTSASRSTNDANGEQPFFRLRARAGVISMT